MQFQPIPDIQRALVEKFYRAHRSPMRTKGNGQIWIAKDREIVGAMSLRTVEDGHWLTGLFVAPEKRAQGIARDLIEAAMASVEGPVWLFCEPELTQFYQRLGFVVSEDLPQELVARLARYRQTRMLIALQHDRAGLRSV